MNIAHSGSTLNNFMSFITHSSQVFLTQPLHFTPPGHQLQIFAGQHQVILTVRLTIPSSSSSKLNLKLKLKWDWWLILYKQHIVAHVNPVLLNKTMFEIFYFMLLAWKWDAFSVFSFSFSTVRVLSQLISTFIQLKVWMDGHGRVSRQCFEYVLAFSHFLGHFGGILESVHPLLFSHFKHWVHLILTISVRNRNSCWRIVSFVNMWWINFVCSAPALAARGD